MRSPMNNRLTGAGFVLLASVVTTYGCSSSDEGGYETLETDDTASSATSSGSGSGGASSGSGTTVPSGTPTSAVSGISGITTGFQPGDPEPVDETCAAADTPTMLQQVVLAFVFDVSASMGNGQYPYFSRELKWEPVVAATKAFFEDTNSKGLSASMTFFPNAKAPIASGGVGMGMSMGDECVAADYATPDVPVTALPSPAFAAAIDAVSPPDDATWRLGTPTLPAVEGTIQAIQALQAADPSTRYTMVVVTDGMPALCPGIPDQIDPVVDAVAAVADTISTYVIGVENPVTEEEPNPPDTVSDLNLLAQAGGTDTAFLINTDDPAQTTAQFKAIVDTIREFTFSCSLTIPEPANGEEFDKNKVNVKYTSDSLGEIPFTYDPTCPADGNGWFYDDEANPTTIQICANVCDAIRVQLDEGNLNVELGCQTRIK
ncbi:MAG TPA: vWA domain-containing protein [Polyangiaceae bacterium]|nr:vWA domain-containing protein [Polyangiaceae bacterium]